MRLPLGSQTVSMILRLVNETSTQVSDCVNDINDS